MTFRLIWRNVVAKPFRFLLTCSAVTLGVMFTVGVFVFTDSLRATFGDLKGVLFAFARHLFGADTDLRFRANHFPFTEPSAEMDVRWRGEWLEWGGCGMIHPRVLARCEIDPGTWQGFACGMGIDRTALLRWGFPTLRPLFEGDMRILEQI